MNCLHCNKDFESDSKLSKYCSRSCYNKAKSMRYRSRLSFNKICIYCKTSFITKHKDAEYCSSKCVSRGTANKKKKYIDIPDCLENSSRKIDKKIGYVRVYAPMHHEANTWGYVYEHRLIAEQIIGRELTKDEIVHHKNGKRWDNRPENLEVMNKIEHGKLKGQRKEDLEI